MRDLAAIPFVWGTGGALASTTISENSLIPLGMFLAGILFTGAMLWRAGRYTQRQEMRISSLERKVGHLADTVRKLERERVGSS